MPVFSKKKAKIAALAERLWRGPFDSIATAIETESALVDQTPKTQLEYRVVGINQFDEGSLSNTVMVVL